MKYDFACFTRALKNERNVIKLAVILPDTCTCISTSSLTIVNTARSVPGASTAMPTLTVKPEASPKAITTGGIHRGILRDGRDARYVRRSAFFFYV